MRIFISLIFVFAANPFLTVHLNSISGLDETTIPEGEEKPIVDMLREYVEFVNSVENDRIQRKVEDQLGRKIILLRMQLSLDNFSSSFSPVACDRLVADINSPSTVKRA